MRHSINSYAFDTFQASEQNREIARLQAKAAILGSIDQKNWQQVELKPGMKILDLGCGSGAVSCELAKYYSHCEVVGIDSSAVILEKAEQLKTSEGLHNLSFQQGNAHSLPDSEAAFDFVYCRFLFQHLTDPLAVLTQIQRVLQPNGILCVLDVDENWFSLYPEPESFTRLRQALVPIQQAQGGDPFVGRKLGSYLVTAGLKQVKTLIHPVSSDDMGLAHFLELLSFGAPYYQRADLAAIAAQARSDVDALLSLPYAWAGIGLLSAIGRKR